MNNETKIQLKEEWIKDFGNPPLMLEELTKEMSSRCALCGIKAEQISDWWLSKIDSLLKSQRDNLVENISKENWHAIEGSNGMCSCGELKGNCKERLLSLIEQDNI